LMASSGAEEVVQLRLELIDRNPHQTRTRFKEEPLKELAESIKVQGVLQPIVVRPGQEGRYRLILGERRMRAATIAGLETIPAIVKRVSEQQAAEMTLVENLQRQDLNCVEQAWAFSRMSQEFKLTQEQIGARVGMSREAVSNYMRLLTLPEAVHEMLIGGKLSYSHARALLKLNTSSHEVIWAYAKKALDEKMSVAKLEELVAGLPRAPKAPGPGGARWVDPNVKAAQRKLEEILGMRVRIRDRAGRGKILIEYATIEDFDRVVEMLGGK
jgi:ParB family transcriptional regulator, chromosome partitioning protein